MIKRIVLIVFVFCIAGGLFSADLSTILSISPKYNLKAGVNFSYCTPIGYWADEYLSTGYGFEVNFDLNPRMLDNITFEFRVGYISFPWKVDPSIKYNFFPLYLNLKYQFALSSFLKMNFKAGAGYYFMFFNRFDSTEKWNNPLVSAGMTFDLNFSRDIAAFIGVDYKSFFDSEEPRQDFIL